jgi:hypothetical protein
MQSGSCMSGHCIQHSSLLRADIPAGPIFACCQAVPAVCCGVISWHSRWICTRLWRLASHFILLGTCSWMQGGMQGEKGHTNIACNHCQVPQCIGSGRQSCDVWVKLEASGWLQLEASKQGVEWELGGVGFSSQSS